jgi:hypothetical protein
MSSPFASCHGWHDFAFHNKRHSLNLAGMPTLFWRAKPSALD